MTKEEQIESYIDKIVNVFPRTNEFKPHEVKFDSFGDELPKHKTDPNYQFANTELDSKDITKRHKAFTIPPETFKFIYQLKLSKNKKITIEDNHIKNSFIDKTGKQIDIDILIDIDNKTLKYEKIEKNEDIPNHIYIESYKVTGSKEEIYKEKDKMRRDKNKIFITNTRSNTIYENGKYLETSYEKDTIVKTQNEENIIVLRINDYKLANGTIITSKKTNNDEKYYIFYKNELDIEEKNILTKEEFEELLKIRNDIYELENNDIIYNFKHKKSKAL